MAKRLATEDWRLKTGDLKVALVCDWLTGIGGAERVLLELHKMFPEAPIYTSQHNSKKIGWFKDADVRTGWLQRLPSGLKKFLPVLRLWYFWRLDLSQYDLVISESGAEAKAIKFGPNTTHLCICNAPTHYYWSRYDNYLKQPGFGLFNPLARIGLRLLVKPLRRWDKKAATRPSALIAISTHIQNEIKKYYGRDSVVIHPPVDTARFTLSASDHKLPVRRGFVTAGRQTPYKRVDLAVAACTSLELPLTVIGNGPDHQKLVDMAGPTITFVTNATDQELARYFVNANAFIFPGLDDFGIVAIEALASGTPVIAYKGGGALDYMVEGETGKFFTEQSAKSLINALQSFNHSAYDPETIKKYAERFSALQFHKNFQKFLNDIALKR